ncbi:MAG: phosphate ABC transporter permease family protein [Marinobacter sp.]
MQPANLLLLTIVLALVAYGLGYARSRALAMPLGGVRHLKSLPGYYGVRAAVWCGLPALIILGFWVAFEGKVIQLIVIGSLPPDIVPAGQGGPRPRAWPDRSAISTAGSPRDGAPASASR